MKRLTILALAAPFLSTPALAQEDPPEWQGEGRFGAGVTTGNTETTDVSVGGKLRHNGSFWSQSGEFTAEYGETDGAATRERYSAAGQLDFRFGDRASSYGRFTWERDEFSGFENRYFAGLGLAYQVIKSEPTQWTLQGGPGYRIDEVRASPPGVTPAVAATTEESFGAAVGSHFQHRFNPNVMLTNDTDVTYADTSTQYKNALALTFDLMGSLQARISYDVRHETDPPAGFEATDTATRFSLVYKIG